MSIRDDHRFCRECGSKMIDHEPKALIDWKWLRCPEYYYSLPLLHDLILLLDEPREDHNFDPRTGKRNR